MIKKFAILFFALLWMAILTNGQTLRRPVAAAYIGLGAYSLLHPDVFSFTANQAALARLKNTAVGVYGERPFLLNELTHYTTAFTLPTTSGNFGLKAGYAGFSDYNETQLGLAYGRSLGNKIDIGVQFNYQGIRVAGYGNAVAVSFEIGTILHVSQKLQAGFHINNPVGGKYSKGSSGNSQAEKLASLYTFGLGYDASEKFFISAEIEKEENQPVNVNAGFQYKFNPQLLVRAGISSATSSVYAGVGITLKSARLDITSSFHPQLGVSPGLLFLFNLKKKGS